MTIGTLVAASFTQRAVRSVSSGSCPIVEPMPRSGIPCGQEKLHSIRSTPAASRRLTNCCQSSFFAPMMLAATTLSGNSFFRALTSFSTSSICRSEIKSIFWSPMSFLSSKSMPDIMGYTSSTTSVSTDVVFKIAPPQPASNALATISAESVVGAAARVNGFGNFTPQNSNDKSTTYGPSSN